MSILLEFFLDYAIIGKESLEENRRRVIPVWKIGGIFGRSPLRPLHEHMVKVSECLALLKPLVRELINQDYEKLEEYSLRISELEHEADLIKEGIRESLSRSSRVAVERSDVLNYLKEQDRIADTCEDVGKMLVMRRMKLPAKITERLLKLTEKVLQAGEGIKEVTGKLKNLEGKTRLGRGETEEISRLLNLVAKREWEADEMQLDFAKEVFKLEKELDPVTVFFLMNIGKTIGAIADYAENTGDCLRRIIAR
jgi:predicted phosphate transport protein (TIGR00153 family)